MKSTIEKKIRRNAIIIYLIVAASCGILVFYLYNVRGNTHIHKLEIEQYRKILAQTNELIFQVNGSQTTVNLFVSTKEASYLRRFRREIKEISLLIDSIASTSQDSVQERMLRQIDTLLRRQATAIAKLNEQLAKENPVIIINHKLQAYEPETKSDSVFITTMTQDTIVNAKKKKNFFRRLAEVFAPRQDSVFVVVNQRVDTVVVAKPDTLALISEVDSVARQAALNYDNHIRIIEKHASRVISSNQEISQQIARLLIELYQQTLDATLEAIDKGDQMVNKNYSLSIIGGGVALTLILVFIILILRDVNKGKAARMELEIANERTRQLMESRHKLLLSVSHDIKTPLSSILGYLDLWHKKGQDVRSMQNSGKHILALLENLLEFSSLEQGKLKISSNNFKPYELCLEIAELFEPMAQQKGLTFIRDLRIEKDIILYGDIVKIKQVVINIISNALKYTYEGSVTFYLGYDGEQLRIEIKDTGIGIAKEKQQQLFQPFSRVESNNFLAEGNGLGMFVVKGLIELMQGGIKIESKVGIGTTIKVSIPVISIEATLVQGIKHIAVIDDDPAILALTKEMLCELGHTVSTFPNPKIYVPCDVILTDMEMGNYTGLDVLEAAKGTPVIIMTGKSEFTRDMALQMGFTDYIAKPFTMDALSALFGRSPDAIEDLFGGDEELRQEIIEIFKSTTNENLNNLVDALANNDFTSAQAICHKMIGMFAQLEISDVLLLLRKIDTEHHQTYDEWKEDVKQVITLATQRVIDL